MSSDRLATPTWPQEVNGSWLRKGLLRIFISGLSVGFTLLALEVGVRMFWPVGYLRPPVGQPQKLLHRRSTIPGLTYEMAPNRDSVIAGVPVRTNSYGMRDFEPALAQGDSHIRIAVLGDSYTFGWRLPVEESYPKLLERRLNESRPNGSPRFDVLNFGVIGYSSRDEALVLKYKALAWDPKLVVIGYVLNDPEIDPIQPLHGYFDKRRWWTYSQVFRLIAEAKRNWDMRRLGGGDYYRYLHAEAGEKWQSVVQAFEQIKGMTSPRGIRVLVVIFPEICCKYWSTSWSDYPYRAIHKQVADLAARDGFEVLDLYDSYSRYPPRELAVSRSDDHPTRLGHEVTAQAIHEKLLTEDPFLFKAEETKHHRSSGRF